ncbi:hypothetical protein L596_001133 [Steinernema carpocapsae]|uniref:Uncharacterized protein n=1 Tax=Steinernema carpocapsae TaxID=34508 RepID=A0A4U8UMG5_STECR|nr:hypothetical protein L596_001133 [Steinernema carpocapsae]
MFKTQNALGSSRTTRQEGQITKRTKALPSKTRTMSIPEAVNVIMSYYASFADLFVAVRTVMDHTFGMHEEGAVRKTFDTMFKKHTDAQAYTSDLMRHYPLFYKWDLIGITQVENLPPHVAHLWKEILQKMQVNIPRIPSEKAFNLWRYIREDYMKGKRKEGVAFRLHYLAEVTSQPMAKEYSDAFWPELFELCGIWEVFYSKDILEATVPQELLMIWNTIFFSVRINFPDVCEQDALSVWGFMKKVYLTPECPEKYRGQLPFLEPSQLQTTPIGPPQREKNNNIENLTIEARAAWTHIVAMIQEKLPFVTSEILFNSYKVQCSILDL